MSVEVLFVRLGIRPPYDFRECSKERWREVMSRHLDGARHAANLAAHGWDILLVDDRVLLTQPSDYRSTEMPGSHWLDCWPPHGAIMPPAEPELLETLYELRGRHEGHARKFALPPSDSDTRPKDGDAGSTRE